MKLSTRHHILAVCMLFSLCVVIFMSIALAGSSADYKPITNVYVGKAKISEMNITKVIPALDPILGSLSGAFNAPNATVASVFDVVEKFVNTTAFKPLLTLLATSSNGTASVGALVSLAPMLMAGTSKDATVMELNGLTSLFNTSTNVNQTISGMNDMISTVNLSDTSLLEQSAMVMKMLADSSNPKETTESLIGLNSLTFPQKASMLPVFRLFQNSNDTSTTLKSLSTFMNTTVPTSMANNLFEQLQTETDATKLAQTIGNFGTLAPTMKPVLEALENIIKTSLNATLSLETMQQMLAANLTTADYAKTSFSSLSKLIQDSSNASSTLQSVQVLAANTDSTTSTKQLKSLDTILGATNDSSSTVSAFNQILTALSENPSSLDYVPYLFQVLENSTDPAKTMNALNLFATWAMSNLLQLAPALPLLQNVVKYPQMTTDQLAKLYPEMFAYFNVPSAFSLSVFTLCEYDYQDNIDKCSKPHAVQNMNFTDIIWTALLESKFAPYLTALDITNQKQLHLDGKMLHRQHQYVPAIKAFLALSILSIIFSFFFIPLLAYIFHKNPPLSNKFWFFVVAYAILTAIFTGIATVLTTCIINIIKSGTKDDNYGVVFTYSSAFMGLTWTSFCLPIIVCPLLFWVWMVDRKAKPSTIIPEYPEESTATESIEEVQKEKFDSKIKVDGIQDSESINSRESDANANDTHRS
ncbi:hypothetical protein TBLA_0F03370 [Henningerozyma blattae CBS 6284]|uniref:Uncharacterized protein n=1 Tax=Henningerozyma blattae (strain ATCC 34711 / CBS 6284 / DSM 70876 / NBRC 10599 / NRRL Y-10934 / UCD 77-7) TaxID=1071380 RepID=I2H672_HENB6|nr:hypothetical protein TBLA_0F03370 [Tetrapisispora blattae CBS 6284]CCH61874.1 hypothetical protein TBLA_0F03370 [Tetrapisispora blattae CBS 6284]